MVPTREVAQIKYHQIQLFIYHLADIFMAVQYIGNVILEFLGGFLGLQHGCGLNVKSVNMGIWLFVFGKIQCVLAGAGSGIYNYLGCFQRF